MRDFIYAVTAVIITLIICMTITTNNTNNNQYHQKKVDTFNICLKKITTPEQEQECLELAGR